jgi:hypothetical protein
MQGEGARGPHRSPEPRVEEQGGRAILGPNADDLEAGITSSRDGERPAALHGENVDPREDLLMLLQQLTSVTRFGISGATRVVQLEMTEELKEDPAPGSRKKHSCAPGEDAAWPADVLPRESEAHVAGRFESTGRGLELAGGGQNRHTDKQGHEIARPVAAQIFCVPMQVFYMPMQVFCFSPLTASLVLTCFVRHALQPNVS